MFQRPASLTTPILEMGNLGRTGESGHTLCNYFPTVPHTECMLLNVVVNFESKLRAADAYTLPLHYLIEIHQTASLNQALA